MRKAILCLFLLTAIPAMAGQPFVGLVDLDRGLVLVPEGTEFPRGVQFFISERPDEAGRQVAPQRKFVFAHAPEERFVKARQRIAETQPREVRAFADMDQTYYFYFYDDSYHAARKYIQTYNTNPYLANHGVQTFTYTAGGDYDARATASQTSTTHTGYNVSRTCYFYGSGGHCYTPVHAYGGGSNFTSTVSSKGLIVQYLYPPCDLPCKRNLQSTIVISFP